MAESKVMLDSSPCTKLFMCVEKGRILNIGHAHNHEPGAEEGGLGIRVRPDKAKDPVDGNPGPQTRRPNWTAQKVNLYEIPISTAQVTEIQSNSQRMLVGTIALRDGTKYHNVILSPVANKEIQPSQAVKRRMTRTKVIEFAIDEDEEAGDDWEDSTSDDGKVKK
ncbi:hypothetical protein AYL99_11722 [Fonsecaea erecta]|uniref:Uncharacterized protein n=1 Tax=Fonsecaea erecta TaxID=1367422 RepID=A0A178Z383_9EURO|nr:hypothetical protein AYL99_11722 [Fonsecaea erecta]OAP54187.1 hypothetical protein AYL99_11722 [Fonsecaea erecta]